MGRFLTDAVFRPVKREAGQPWDSLGGVFPPGFRDQKWLLLAPLVYETDEGERIVAGADDEFDGASVPLSMLPLPVLDWLTPISFSCSVL